MAKSMKLSTHMQKVIEKIAAAGGVVERRAGGFWTFPGCASHGASIPIWWTGTQTIMALEARGVLVRCNVNGREKWNDDRRLA